MASANGVWGRSSSMRRRAGGLRSLSGSSIIDLGTWRSLGGSRKHFVGVGVEPLEGAHDEATLASARSDARHLTRMDLQVETLAAPPGGIAGREHADGLFRALPGLQPRLGLERVRMRVLEIIRVVGRGTRAVVDLDARPTGEGKVNRARRQSRRTVDEVSFQAERSGVLPPDDSRHSVPELEGLVLADD